MSVLNYMFDYALLKNMEQLSSRVALSNRHVNRTQRHRVEELEREVGELALTCRALMGMLKEQGHFDAAAFNAALDRIDADDGVIDGRVTPQAERPRRPTKAPPVVAPTRSKRR